MNDDNKLPSQHQIGDQVVIRGQVKAVNFTLSKVTYEVGCDERDGGISYRLNLPSEFVEPAVTL